MISDSGQCKALVWLLEFSSIGIEGKMSISFASPVHWNLANAQ